MDIKLYADYLLENIPTASKAGGGKVINCRCFECPDSSDPRKGHFYISIPQDQQTPSFYYCHKCNCSGIVTYKKLIEWGIYNEQIAINLTKYNQDISKFNINNKYFNKCNYNLINNITSNNNISKIKLDMINKRLGYNFTFEELRKLKIVLNLNDILSQNNINQLTRNKNIVDLLDANFMGFISIDNAFLNMRRLCDEGNLPESIDKRYINYKIFDKFDTSERFYTIPTEINLLSPNRIKLNIAEGPFDILSIYKNVRKEEPGIYTSIAGSNYYGSAMYFLETFRLPFVEIHYYPDNDKSGSNKKIMSVIQKLKPLNCPIYIHRNQYPGEKDFGVSPDRIVESIEKIC